ncbi:MAG: histidinol-phosphate transaminase [Gammaproteobacteria bacterium]|nr:histidinol-phosphate transaminase [Gammaproteobacteria bacterium]
MAAMRGYAPGEQPAPGVRVVKLNTNECPYAPSPRVAQALREFDVDSLRRYPQPMADRFRASAAALYGLRTEQVLAGNGSDDILNIILRAWLDPGDALACPAPTYSLYPVLAQIHGARMVPVPWADDWRLPVDALCATGARLTIVANPNAPSGTLVPIAELRALAVRHDGLLVIDEAYVEFADESALALLAELPNVLLSRTLSKSYGLAGLRFGYALGDARVIAELAKVKDSYNCDALSVAAAVAAIEDQDYARQMWARVRAERARLATTLTQRGCEVIPSQANFLFVRPPGGDGAGLYAALKARGVLVRHFAEPALADRVRITVGTPEENDVLLRALP